MLSELGLNFQIVATSNTEQMFVLQKGLIIKLVNGAPIKSIVCVCFFLFSAREAL